MKKYVGCIFNGGNCNSGIVTLEKAHEWAAKALADRPQTKTVYILEVIETADRVTPTVEIAPFVVPKEEPALKKSEDPNPKKPLFADSF